VHVVPIQSLESSLSSTALVLLYADSIDTQLIKQKMNKTMVASTEAITHPCNSGLRLHAKYSEAIDAIAPPDMYAIYRKRNALENFRSLPAALSQGTGRHSSTSLASQHVSSLRSFSSW
jgi:hypothetical protein